MAEMSMSDILSDKPAEKPAEAPKEQLDLPAVDKPAADATKDTPPATERPSSRKQAHRDKEQDAQGRVRDPETGQYTSKEAPAAETAPAKEAAKDATKEPAKVEAKPAIAAPQQEFTEKEKAFQRAMMEERGKRQELERRLAAVEAAKAAGSPNEPAKTFWDDPEAALAKHRAEISNVTTNVRLQTAELIARQKHSDFDAKIEVFGQVLQQTPGLHAQWLAASDPAEFAYNIGKNHMELQAAGSMEEMRAKIERETAARVRAEVEAELKAKADALARDRAALPGSLSDARASGVNKPVWGGPPSMSDILGGK